ncbi:glycosyltransferase family 15 protein [Atractiella rhizophila]|nr:glycosyltransferase family 15 protein [Atractiella rhizophila]
MNDDSGFFSFFPALFGGISDAQRERQKVLFPDQGWKEPGYRKDEETGLWYPPDISEHNEYKKSNAAFVSLVRNSELSGMKDSIRSVESHFNRRAGYPWVFLNDEPFTDAFKEAVQSLTRSKCYFETIPREHWSYPEWVDEEVAREKRKEMERKGVMYGGMESYHHMCRFQSGFFYKQKILEQFDYYWRVEPDVEFYCDLNYDPFHFMEVNNKSYAFTISLHEREKTIETLWPTVQEFARLHPEHIAKDNSLNFIVDEKENGMDGGYNLCHFWSNFEIGDLRFWRSKAYNDFFDHLDRAGGFFYERWGDAPVHSIAASLFLPSSSLHQFDDIAYRHTSYMHCPNSKKALDRGKCNCNPRYSFDTKKHSCMKEWWRVTGRPLAGTERRR